MATESGMGWQLGISGEQAMAGLAEYARLVRAEADQAMPSGIIQIRHSVTDEEVERIRGRWSDAITTSPWVTQIYTGPTWTVTPHVHPVEAFAACPHCKTPPHYPLIVGRHDSDDAMCLIRECMYCHNTWIQQEPA
jgi:hypothetical protein